MKLIIQIPCYNEEETLAIALRQLPREVPGFDCVEWLVINDGSRDRTVEVAREEGADHIVDLPHNHGLAVAFIAGLEACVAAGADVIVNTDADNQYQAADIPVLVKPILDKKAEIVIGARPISSIEHFSFAKKMLQKLGSYVVRRVSGTDIPDAPSGFRAISRNAAMRLNVFSEYTYTLETIIQAGQRNIPITWVPVRTNEDLRPSRLVKSMRSYIKRSVLTIIEIFVVYRPFRFFAIVGLIPFTLGMLIGARWLILTYIIEDGRTHLPSLVLAAILFIAAFQTWVLAYAANLISINRRLLESIQLRARRSQEPLFTPVETRSPASGLAAKEDQRAANE